MLKNQKFLVRFDLEGKKKSLDLIENQQSILAEFLLLSINVQVSQNFVAFSEYMNFKGVTCQNFVVSLYAF